MSAPDVEQIEAVLRSDPPEPSPAFAAELDRRVREGFPKPPRRRRVWLRPALAGAAVLVVVAVVAFSVVGGGDRQVTSSVHGDLTAPRDLSARPAPAPRPRRSPPPASAASSATSSSPSPPHTTSSRRPPTASARSPRATTASS